jgi:hypothetical protein
MMCDFRCLLHAFPGWTSDDEARPRALCCATAVGLKVYQLREEAGRIIMWLLVFASAQDPNLERV